MKIAGRVVLVTGAAQGIGAAVAGALAGAGVAVAALDANADGLAGLVSGLRDAGGRAAAYPADVADSVAVEAAVERAERELGPIDMLVNVAGVLRAAPALELSDEDWARTFAVNTAGVFHVSRAVARRMVQRGGGAIVTVGSNAATVPRVQLAAYAASKAAATMFTKCLGLELALGRLAAPSDIADAVLFLLSDQARHITLHDLCVDGGATLGA